MPPDTRAGESPLSDVPKPASAPHQDDISADTEADEAPDAPPSDDESSTSPSSVGAETVTPGGYSYTLVDDGAGESAVAERPRRPWRRLVPWLALAAAVPAVVVGLVVWFFALGGGGSTARQNADVTSLLNLVGNQQGATAKRYEGSLAPGYPSDVPAYPGSRLISSIRQVRGQDVQYLAVYDSTDNRSKVAQYFQDRFNNGPWQVQGGQTSRDSTIHEFSRVDSSDVSGVVLVAESQKDTVTTILLSLQLVSGAKDDPKPVFAAPADARLPDGFPDTVPSYPGSNTIQAAYQKQSGKKTYAASFVTKDDAASALSYYRDAFTNNGWTVQDADASQSTTVTNGQAIQFKDSSSQVTGLVTLGTFDEDDSYTRIDVQVTVANAPSGG